MREYGEPEIREVHALLTAERRFKYTQSVRLGVQDGVTMYSNKLEEHDSTCSYPLLPPEECPLADLEAEWGAVKGVMKGRLEVASPPPLKGLLEGYLQDKYSLSPLLMRVWNVFRVIEPTSSGSERVFSTLGWLLSARRAGMGEDTVWALLRIHDNPERRLSPAQVRKVIEFFREGKNPWLHRRRPTKSVSKLGGGVSQRQRRPIIPFTDLGSSSDDS